VQLRAQDLERVLADVRGSVGDACYGWGAAKSWRRTLEKNRNPPEGRPFLTSPLGANFDPQGRSCPPGVNLSPRGEVIPWG
jgi:hypothetical protein